MYVPRTLLTNGRICEDCVTLALLASPDVPLVSCAAVDPAVGDVLTDVDDLAVAMFSLLLMILLW